MKYTDETLMPFGKFKGEKLEDVPGDYLLYLEKQGIPNKDLQDYIDENRDFLKADANNNTW